jgi:hypothetical protein
MNHTEDAWEISVLSQDPALVRALADGASSNAIPELKVGTSSRVPGQNETFAYIVSQIANLPANIVGGLIATWLWNAFQSSGSASPLHLALRRNDRTVEIEVSRADESLIRETVVKALPGDDSG